MKTRFESFDFVSVQVSEKEVEAFADRWPCSGLKHGLCGDCSPGWFEFHKGTGDLVDVSPSFNDPRIDGEALKALAADAKTYAFKRDA